MTNPPKTTQVKTLQEAKNRIAELEDALAGRPIAGKPTQKPVAPNCVKPFGGVSKAVEAVNGLLSGKFSIDDLKTAVKSASTVKEKLLVILDAESNIRAAIANCKTEAEKAPLWRNLLEAQTEEAYIRLAQDIQDGPRASRSRTLLERRGLS